MMVVLLPVALTFTLRIRVFDPPATVKVVGLAEWEVCRATS